MRISDWSSDVCSSDLAPDTSPRGDTVPNDEAYDFGKGAGFYVDATEAPWSKHFRMESYITRDLPALIAEQFPANMARQANTGHSMGGHGGVNLAPKNQDRLKSAWKGVGKGKRRTGSENIGVALDHQKKQH